MLTYLYNKSIQSQLLPFNIVSVIEPAKVQTLFRFGIQLTLEFEVDGISLIDSQMGLHDDHQQLLRGLSSHPAAGDYGKRQVEGCHYPDEGGVCSECQLEHQENTQIKTFSSIKPITFVTSKLSFAAC